eukprot:11610816-Ditylum_brightwellii.AAC.1
MEAALHQPTLAELLFINGLQYIVKIRAKSLDEVYAYIELCALEHNDEYTNKEIRNIIDRFVDSKYTDHLPIP